MRSSLLYLPGCLLIAGFAVVALVVGGIAHQPGVYQAAYALGCAGLLAIAAGLQRDNGAAPAWLARHWLPAAIVLRLVLLPTTPTDDAYRYVWEGRVQLAGENPYVHAPDDPRLTALRDADWTHINHRDWPAVYPPASQLVFRVCAWLDPGVFTTKALFVVCDVIAVFLIRALLRQHGHADVWAVLYAFCPLTLSAFAVEGHLDSLMLVWTLAAVLLMQRNRWAWAGATLGVAIATKVVAVALVPLLLRRRWWSVLPALAVAALTCLPYADAGWALFEGLRRFGAGTSFFNLFGTLSLGKLPPGLERALAGSLLAGMAVWTLWRPPDIERAAYRLFSGVLAALPVLHAWYLTWALAFVPLTRRWTWLAGAAAMTVYFEAEKARARTGVWAMPRWAAWVFWLIVIVAAVLEWTWNLRSSRRQRMMHRAD